MTSPRRLDLRPRRDPGASRRPALAGLPARPGLRARGGRGALAVGLGLGLALVLGGCSATNEITTDDDYQPSDGVGVDIGDLRVGNLLVLSAAEGEPGTVLGSFTNRGSQDADVTVGLADGSQEPAEMTVPAGATVVVGPTNEVSIDFDATPAAPGALVELTLTSSSGGSVTERVPVLDGTLPEYAPLVPDAG